MRMLFKRIINESRAAMKETTPAASPLVDEEKQIVAGKVEPGRWNVQSEADIIEISRNLDVILRNGVCLMDRDYGKIDWTQVADWRYSQGQAQGAAK